MSALLEIRDLHGVGILFLARGIQLLPGGIHLGAQRGKRLLHLGAGRLALRDLLQTLERIDVLLKALDRLTSAASEFL